MPRYALVIFDLDGTLVDSFPWFLRHLDGVSDIFGFRRPQAAEIAVLRHAGPDEILRRLGIAQWKVPLIARHMRRLKTRHADELTMFAGTPEMLRALAAAGIRLALVSSDSEANARRQLGALALLFSDFACGASLFGKAAKFRRVLRSAGVAPRRAIACGDELRDIAAARAAGIACAAVTWGYAAAPALRALAPDVLVDRVEEITAHLLN